MAMDGKIYDIDDLVRLFDKSRIDPVAMGAAQNAMAEFLAAEAAMARASAAEAIAFRLVDLGSGGASSDKSAD